MKTGLATRPEHTSRRLAGLLIAVALTAGVAVISWPQLAVARQVSHNVPAGELVAGRSFGQTFHAAFSGLYRVDVLLATYARQNHGPVLFHLSEGSGGSDLVAIEVEAAQVRDNAFHRFVFEPIADSAGREFFFHFEAPGAAPGNAITIWQADFDAYPSGRAYVDGYPADGDLAFVTYYRPHPTEVRCALGEQVRARSPLLWQARWLMLGVATAWVVGIGLLFGDLLVAGAKDE